MQNFAGRVSPKGAAWSAEAVNGAVAFQTARAKEKRLRAVCARYGGQGGYNEEKKENGV